MQTIRISFWQTMFDGGVSATQYTRLSNLIRRLGTQTKISLIPDDYDQLDRELTRLEKENKRHL